MNIDLKNINGFDLNKEVYSVEESLNSNAEIKAISMKLRINDYNSLFSFGTNISNEVSTFINKAINTLKNDNTSVMNELTDKLSVFVSKLEPSDFIPKEKTFLSSFFKKNTDIPLDELYKKYTPILLEADRLIVAVRGFQNNLKNANTYLFQLFERSLYYYTQVRKHSKALDLFRNDITVKSQLNSNFRDMMDKRHYNLGLVETIALQQTVAIKNVISNNSLITENLDSFYIATLPLLKQCILNSITLKKQSLKSKSNELIQKQINEAISTSPDLSEKLKTAFVNSENLDRETLLKTIEILKSGIKETTKLKDKREEEIKTETLELTKLNEEIRKA